MSAKSQKGRVTLLKLALLYASKGLPVIPIHTVCDGRCSCENPNCSSAGKHPITSHGVKDATVDRKTIKKWWSTNPDANIGIATGRQSNLVVLDVDGEPGKKSLAMLRKKHGRLPKTVKVVTGKGRHYYLKPGDASIKNSAGQLGTGVDIRGDGGYVVAPGSVHQSGSKYAFAKGCDVRDIVIAEAPEWLLTAATKIKQIAPTDVKPIPTPKMERSKAYMHAAFQRELERLGKAPKHQRNNTLNLCAFRLGQLLPYGLLNCDEVVRELTRVATNIGLEAAETEATIDSGISAGRERPRSLPFLNSSENQTEEIWSADMAKADLTQKLPR